ncbi:MAG TPA: hypothetical protein VKA46_32450 [Gemmataceae bacterium]|nr:hypothetical protein [Gemmataceae bacterium]
MRNHTDSTLSAEQAEAVLRQRLCGRVRHLRVHIRAEGVVLQGVAANYYGKQMAQHLAHKLLGMLVLTNEIEVRSFSSPPPGDGEAPG